MVASPDMAFYDYEELSDKQFRLFSFTAPGSDTTISLNMTIENLSGVSQPIFEAISYVWGNDAKEQTITVNGKLCNVTQSLYRVLVVLQASVHKNDMFWADAICINQNNRKEKWYQIQAMGLIYVSARLVHIFPDSDFQSTKITATKLTELSNVIAVKPPPGTNITDTYLEANQLPKQDDPIWSELGELLQLPWFQRLWVVQEAVLAKELILHLNGGTILWKDFILAIQGIKAYDMEHSVLKGTAASNCGLHQETSGIVSALFIHGWRSRHIHQHALLRILHVVGQKLCKEPTDRVYAWLWLLPEASRKEISPLHLVPPNTPLWKTYLEMSIVALNEYPTMLTLPLACTRRRLPDLPSWCINLQSDVDCFIYASNSFNAGGEPEPAAPALVAYSRQGRQIHLKGIEVCTVKDVFPPRFLCTGDPRHPACSASVLKWVSLCLNYCETNGLSQENLLRVLVSDTLRSAQGEALPIQELQLHYIDMIKYWSQSATGTHSGVIEMTQTEVQRAAAAGQSFTRSNTGRRLIITSSGLLGLAHHTVLAGDRICVFQGVQSPYLLRSNGNQDGIFTFVSDSWIYGLMNMEAFDKDLSTQVFIVE